ncbi:cold-shock protein [Streptomyces sp. NPDC001667]
MFTGVVKWFSAGKGYGFISRDDGESDVFVHHVNIEMPGYRTLQGGQQVEFDISSGDKGLQAINVHPLSCSGVSK